MTPYEAAFLLAEHGAPLGHSIMRTADALLRNRDSFETVYRQAAKRCDRTVFPELLEAHGVLAAHHDRRKEPRDRDPE
jgi:hypothetical protein